MKRRIAVAALWDDEARVWVASSKDIRGLSVEADTPNDLLSKAALVIQDLIDLNGFHVPAEEVVIDFHIEKDLVET